MPSAFYARARSGGPTAGDKGSDSDFTASTWCGSRLHATSCWPSGMRRQLCHRYTWEADKSDGTKLRRSARHHRPLHRRKWSQVGNWGCAAMLPSRL